MFNPDYTEVDRVLDESITSDPVTGDTKYYLVKWLSLAYEDSTWELQADVDKNRIEDFYRHRQLPEEAHREVGLSCL